MKHKFKKVFSFLLSMMLILGQIVTPSLASSFNEIKVNRITNSKEIENNIIKISEDCERIIEGQIKFKGPQPPNKPKDLVVIQDTSGSFKSTFKDMQEKLIEVIDDFVDEEDRMMVVDYSGGNTINHYQPKTSKIKYDSKDKKIGEDLVYINDVQKYLDDNYKLLNNKPRTPDNWINVRPTTIKVNEEGLTKDKEAIKKFISDMRAGGGTPSALGLRKALEEYEKLKGDEDRETIFLFITDGIPNHGLDGTIPVENKDGKTVYQQRYQLIDVSLSEVIKEGEAIKDAGYHFATAFIDFDEDKEFDKNDITREAEFLRKAQVAFEYMPSKPEYYLHISHPNKFYDGMQPILESLISELNRKELEVEINDRYNIDDIELDIEGLENIDLKDILIIDKINNKFKINLRDFEPGKDYKLNYKVKENDLYTEDDDNFMKGQISITSEDSKGEISKNIIDLDPIKVNGNKNDKCTLKPKEIRKTVNKKEKDKLSNLKDLFEYRTEVPIENTYGLEKLEIIDEYDSELLDIEKIEVYYVDEDGNKELQDHIKPEVKDGKIITEIPEKDFETIENKKILIKTSSKVKDTKTQKDILDKYKDGNIPSKAELNYKYKDMEKELSNESEEVLVYSHFKEILIEKVDAKTKKPLEEVEFTVKKEREPDFENGDIEPPEDEDEYGDEEPDEDLDFIRNKKMLRSDDKYVTDVDGLVSLGNLGVGKYTIKEVKAKEGYKPLKEEILLEVKEDNDGSKSYHIDESDWLEIEEDEEKVKLIVKNIPIEAPDISKDVEGKEEIKVYKGEHFKYNLTVYMPKDTSGYKVIEVKDDIDKDLEVLSVDVYIDGEKKDIFEIVENNNDISLKLKGSFKEVENKIVNIEINTKVKEDSVKDIIYNEAELHLNDEKISTEKVRVVPKEREILIEKIDAKTKKPLEEVEFTVEKEREPDFEVGGEEPPEDEDEYGDEEPDEDLDFIRNIKMLRSDDKYITDVDGLVSLGNLGVGKYTIKEVKAKEGYKPLEEEILLEVKEDDKGIKSYHVNESNMVEIKEDGDRISLVIKNNPIESPSISKDVQGKKELGIIKGEQFDYNVKVNIPEDVSGYKEIKITDNLDKDLTIVETKVYINNSETDLKASIRGNRVELLIEDEFDKFSGKEIKLVITTKIKENSKKDTIENLAELKVNDSKISSEIVKVHPKYKGLYIKKVDADNNNPLKGAKFKLTGLIKKEVSNKTNKDEKNDIIKDELEDNKDIELKKENVSEEIKKNKEDEESLLEGTEEKEEIVEEEKTEIEIEDVEDEKIGEEIDKEVNGNGEDLEEVIEKIYTSDDNGYIDLGELEAGEYDITEIEAPEGYENSQKTIKLIISEDEFGGRNYRVEGSDFDSENNIIIVKNNKIVSLPDGPNEPDKPSIPTNPVKPDQPNPEKPVKPVKPEKPVKPKKDIIDNKNDEVEKLEINNKLPKTGESNSIKLSLIGIVFISLGIFLFKKKNQEEI